MTTRTSLTEILTGLYEIDPDMLLSDGAATRTVDNLLDLLRDAEDEDSWTLGAADDGRNMIYRIREDGYRNDIPVYVQQLNA